jgi:hypothetical protein
MPRYDDTIEHSGITVQIRYEPDYDRGAPWDEDCGHGDIRQVDCSWGRPDKRPGEVILYSHRGAYWLYDYQGAIKKAKADGWGCRQVDNWGLPRPPMTKNQVAAQAVEEDMDFLRGYLQGDWGYVGIIVTAFNADGDDDEDGYETDEDSCWGFETYRDYHFEAGREMAIALAERVLERRQAEAAAAALEALEVAYWASRDVVTV